MTACQSSESIYLGPGNYGQIPCPNTATAIMTPANLRSHYAEGTPRAVCTGCATRNVVSLALGVDAQYRITVEPIPPLPTLDLMVYGLLWAGEL